MSAPPVFFDTNILVYLLSNDARKADLAEALLMDGGWVSVQVLNEAAAVCRRKLRLGWSDTDQLVSTIRKHCAVTPLTTSVHEAGLSLSRRHGLQIYDSMICAAAQTVGAATLYSEDMQHGQRLDSLVITNPFLG